MNKIGICAALLLTGCGGIASKDAITFGTVVERNTSGLSAPNLLLSEVQNDLATNLEACRYLAGRSYNLGRSPKSTHKPSQSTQKLLDQHGELIKNIEGYAAALTQVTDPSGLQKLEQASKALTQQTTAIVAAVPTGTPATAVAGPAIGLVVNGVVNFSEVQRRQRIKRIVVRTHDAFVAGLGAVIKARPQFEAATDAAIVEWDRAARCVLSRSRGNTQSGAYSLFVTFDARLRELQNLRLAVTNLPDVMGALFNAHLALRDSKDDLEYELGVIENLLADLRALNSGLATI